MSMVCSTRPLGNRIQHEPSAGDRTATVPEMGEKRGGAGKAAEHREVTSRFTLPAALPLAVLSDGTVAPRVSQGIGLTMLFLSGSALGHCAGFGAWRSGFAMLAVGVALVSLVVALGG